VPANKAVTWGLATNRHRDWDKGNHPGYTLATRLRDKTDQVWLFTTVFSVPWTNNASEQALKSAKLHQKVSGYWHTPHHPRQILQSALLPHQLIQPRTPRHRRHPHRTHRQPLDTTNRHGLTITSTP
jgi:hypothetical protein